jgi:hypothetical protein
VSEDFVPRKCDAVNQWQKCIARLYTFRIAK